MPSHPFDSCITIDRTFRASIETLVDDLIPLITLLKIRNKIPSSACAVRLNESHFDSVVMLHSLVFQPSPEEVRLRLSGMSKSVNYSTTHSTVLMLDDTVVGTFLAAKTKDQRIIFIYGLVIMPKLRRTWATPYFKYSSFCHLQEANISSVEFHSYNNNRDTLKHAFRVRADELKELTALI